MRGSPGTRYWLPGPSSWPKAWEASPTQRSKRCSPSLDVEEGHLTPEEPATWLQRLGLDVEPPCVVLAPADAELPPWTEGIVHPVASDRELFVRFRSDPIAIRVVGPLTPERIMEAVAVGVVVVIEAIEDDLAALLEPLSFSVARWGAGPEEP